MKLRQAQKILREWSRRFGKNEKPKEVYRFGRMPWSWTTWKKAHEVVSRWAGRRARRRHALRCASDTTGETR